jgi:hypothetical protein
MRRHPTCSYAAETGNQIGDMTISFGPGLVAALALSLALFTGVCGRGILRSSLAEIQKPHILKKVRFGGAPVLDREYAATVTHKVGCDEHSVGTLRRGYSSTNIRAGS